MTGNAFYMTKGINFNFKVVVRTNEKNPHVKIIANMSSSPPQQQLDFRVSYQLYGRVGATSPANTPHCCFWHQWLHVLLHH